MSTTIENRSNPDSGSAKLSSAPSGTLSSVRLNPSALGLGFGATGVVLYLGCMLAMATVPREKAVAFFNSLLHGLDVEPILKTSVPAGEVVLGLTHHVYSWLVCGGVDRGILQFGTPHTTR